MRFSGKNVFITGGGGFIGSAVARRLASEGARVGVCDIRAEMAEKTAQAIRDAGGTAEGYAIDVTDSADVVRVMDRFAETWGGVDISIHVAGGSARIAGPEAKFTSLVNQEDYVIDRVLKVNLYGALYVARAAAQRMIAQGRGGRILSFSSTVGVNGLTNSTEYAAAKGGVISFTKALAKELGGYGITVNSVAPGVVAREENAAPEYVYNTNFLHKKCTAEHIASLTACLASEEAEFITGQTYICDGGRSLAMKGSE